MNQRIAAPLLLFYPTSPVHVRDWQQVTQKLAGWRWQAIVYNPLAGIAPGIQAKLWEHRVESIELDQDADLEKELPVETAILAVGAVFEPFALELFAWAKQRNIAVVSIEEVAQLALNQYDINNYDAPFDRLFVASTDEHQRFVELGYPSQMLSISGLLANERFGADQATASDMMLKNIGITDGQKPIVYTTAPLRSRLALHNKDDLRLRAAILTEIGIASQRTGRRTVVKLHPNEDAEPERTRIQKIIPDAIVLGREINMDDLFAATGILVNRGNSQTCLEAVLRGVPTVVSACGLPTLFHNHGGAYVVENLSQLCETIERAHIEGPADNSRVKAKHFFLPPGGVAGFIAKELSRLVDKPQPINEAAWNWLIKSMLFVGRHDRARHFLKTMESRSAWQQAVYAALSAHAEGRHVDAIKGWHSCRALDPNWHFPHYELAHGYQFLGEYSLAIDHARQAIALHPPYHTLWHEIPMRVLIMASQRSMGDKVSAQAELNALEASGLADAVPELMIEKAAQLSTEKGQLNEAIGCLQNALEQLKRFPVNKMVDAQITERAVSQLCELGDQCERARDYQQAEHCYRIFIAVWPHDVWSKFQIAKLNLRRGKIVAALQHLHSIAKKPEGAKSIIARVLSAPAAARLDPYWPATPRSIVGPLKLTLAITWWTITKLISSTSQHTMETTTTLLCILIFVGRHFICRISAESVRVGKNFRMLGYCLPDLSSYLRHRVKSCPICGGSGQFEYQNKRTPLFRCVRCNHVYARRLPGDRVLNDLYGDLSYWEKDRCHQGITSIQESNDWTTYLQARMGILERLNLLSQPVTSPKSVFEIGCAEGMLLVALKKRGMTVSGCEMNRAVAERGIKTLGVEIRSGPFENLALPEQNFDLVVSFHTLEHMRFPAMVLTKVARILRPDGVVVIEVPCGEEEYDNTDHLHFFSKLSLRLLLNQLFSNTEIIDNAYTNSAGVKIGSLYGVGRGVRSRVEQPLGVQYPATHPVGRSCG